MTFSNYVCWREDMVRSVMDVEATLPPDHIFLATHHPTTMYRGDLTEKSVRIPYGEEQFLKDFLSSPDFAFVPILGTSGTGKSHLIRWLYTRLKATCKEPRYRVLLIPKVGTNLKDIIRLILQDLEGSEFDDYRNRLNSTTSTVSESQAREQLLANLAIAVGASGSHDSSKLSDTQAYLEEALPSLLHDPFFRQQYWLREGGIIQRLIVHTLGQCDSVEIVEERREFTVADLPKDITQINKASAQARDFYTLLVSNDEIQQETVKWLNAHLDEAIAKVLNLGREDLQRLMLDVRRALAKQGAELILLIEDFAKLQGIDREVLEAVLARPQQLGREPLCLMRTALACTTGYFDSLLDTVRTRTDFSVDLNVKTVGDQSLITQSDIQQLVVRYLNATRLSNQEIQEWLAHADEEMPQPVDSVPSACSECPHRHPCHAGFGQVEGMGLYPFTAKALERMHQRVNKGVFNPRTLIKDVLRHTLECHRSELEQGRFPSLILLQHFGESSLSAMLIQDIKTKDTAENADRRKTLLDLWTDGTQLCDLPVEIHTAFNLLPLGVTVQETEISTPTRAKDAPAVFKKVVVPAAEEEGIPFALADKIRIIDQWQNGSSLPQTLAQEVRELMFANIDSRIDWDSELLLQGQFSGKNSKKAFKQKSINFQNNFKAKNVQLQDASLAMSGGISLVVPLSFTEADLRETAIAFQGMLLYNHYKHWQFPDGAKHFRIYARQLEQWSEAVLERIRAYPRKSGEPWNPLPAAVELVALGARMAGHSSKSVENSVNLLFKDLSPGSADRATAWKKLYELLRDKRPQLLDIVQARIACTKGGSSKLQVIDAAQLIQPLQEIERDWRPKVEIPDDLRSDFDVLAKVRHQVDQLLEQAIADEKERQLTPYRKLVEELGEDFDRAAIVNELQQAIAQAEGVGVARTNLLDLRSAVEEFQGTRYKAYIETMKRVQDESENGRLLSQLSTTSQNTMTVIETFLARSRTFLDRSIESAQQVKDVLKQTEAGELEATCYSIEQDLAEFSQFLTEVKGEASCS